MVSSDRAKSITRIRPHQAHGANHFSDAAAMSQRRGSTELRGVSVLRVGRDRRARSYFSAAEVPCCSIHSERETAVLVYGQDCSVRQILHGGTCVVRFCHFSSRWKWAGGDWGGICGRHRDFCAVSGRSKPPKGDVRRCSH